MLFFMRVFTVFFKIVIAKKQEGKKKLLLPKKGEQQFKIAS
jgi:hypothetical protein